MATERSNSVDVMKALAALLIINSHLGSFHSRSWMAVDGLLGNSIFFFTTGFTLAGSLRRDPSQSLWSFLWKRLSRLYPGVWIVMFLLPPMTVEWSPSVAPWFLLYPTKFTFLFTVVPAYPVYYFFVRSPGLSHHLAKAAAFLIAAGCFTKWLYLFQSGNGGFVWGDNNNAPWNLHFWGVMLLGAWFARPDNRERRAIPAGGSLRLALLAVLSFVIYLALRVMALSFMADSLGPAIQSLAVMAMPMATVLIAIAMKVLDQPPFAAWCRSGIIATAITFLATNTWETYLVHEGIARWHFVSSAAWPLGLVLVFVLTFALAPVLRMITARLLQAPNRRAPLTSRR